MFFKFPLWLLAYELEFLLPVCCSVQEKSVFQMSSLSDHNWLTAIAPDPVHEFNEARSECV
jgi:hypothetical protein